MHAARVNVARPQRRLKHAEGRARRPTPSTRDAMDGKPGTADLPPPAAPYDFNKERYYGDRARQHQRFVYVDDFNASIRMVLTRAHRELLGGH